MNIDDRWLDNLVCTLFFIVGLETGTLEFTRFVAPSLYELYREVIAGEPPTAGGFLGDELDELPELHR